MAPLGTRKFQYLGLLDCPFNVTKHKYIPAVKVREIGGILVIIIEARHEKTCLRGFQPGPTQIGLCSHRR